MSQPPNQPYPGQPYPGPSGQGHPGQPQPGEQPWSATPASGYPGGEQPWSSTPASGYPGSYQGQPNPDVPSSVPPGYASQPAYVQQPSYPQPEYAQPVYPPPGYPQSGPPLTGYPPPPPRKKSRAVPITLVSVALFLVLCVGGGTAVYLAGRNTADGIADVLASTAPTPTTARPTEAAPTITIVEPKTLNGRPKVTDAKLKSTVDQLEKNLALLPGSSQTVGGIYGTPSKRDLVMIVAAKSFVSDPKEEVDGAFEGSSFSQLNLTGVTSIPPGPLGGAAKCAKGSDSGVPLALCAWADEGSSGLVISYFTGLSSAKKEFIKIRGLIEKKSN
jgi:hypothetical protein